MALLWEEIAQAKREYRDNSIPKEWRLQAGQIPDGRLNVLEVPVECGILTPREIEITEADAVMLVQKIIEREFSSYEVTLAFCKRASIAHQLVNCLSEIFFDEALEVARHLDTEYATTGVPCGPLHGLPVSLKDCFQVKGTDATIGYTAYANKLTEEDESALTKIMREKGAVLFCKTNVPTALMAGETYNDIFGYTTNPYNRSLSSGGSSGGESALLALKGSPLGVGTDVGGSIRIPASFCGLYSLKPSAGRFPTSGLRDGMEGQEAIRNSVGPMARSLAAVEMWSRAALTSEPWMNIDPDCLPIPYRIPAIPEILCFGLLLDDGIVKPLPPVTRALLQTKTALEAAGHSVISFHIDDPLYVDDLKPALYRSAAAMTVNQKLSKTQQPWPRGMKMLQDIVSGDPKSCSTVSSLWEAQVKRTEYAWRMLQAWAATRKRTGTGREMDALLMPCSPWPACEKYEFSYDTYTSLWNVLDYCATTVPVTKVTAIDVTRPQYDGRNMVEAKVWNEYSPERLLDAPVAIQLVSRRLNEEYFLGVTRVCDDALKAEGYEKT
ncbi:amidase signature domain-containing protein [Aspergillus floccosus]